jgi:predicted RNA-binding Zn ribbon-like protein
VRATPHTDHPAPGELELVRGFVNTRDVEEGTDELADGASAAAWFTDHGVAVGGQPFSGAELGRLIEVREALRTLLLTNNSGDAPDERALAVLNGESARTEIGLRFEPGGSALVTRCDGADCAIARVLSVTHDAMHDGIFARLKVCPAEDCLWAFYDHSRNRSGTWCTMEVCGNRAKARAFRERHKPQPSGEAKR